jgi:hypothetical protein
VTATINADIGDSSANSYLTLQDASAIASTRLETAAWDAATTDTRTRALISATSALDTLSYIGSRTATTQALCWPRNYATTSERTYASDEIPSEIAQATFDLASALITTPTLLNATSSSTSLIPNIANNDLKRVKLDVMEVEWRSTNNQRITPLTALPHLKQLLTPLLGAVSGPTIAITRS